MKDNSYLKVSIIVSVYGVEKYIRECVESILGQTYPHIEVILIDDGSPDNCSSICEEYKRKDSRVSVIHQKNQGLSMARNNGIKEATGDYIMFVDGDDFIDDINAIQKLVERILLFPSDVLNYSYKKFHEETNQKIPYLSGISEMPLTCTTKQSQLEFLTKDHLYIASACNKLIAKKMFEKGLDFKRGVYSEDIEWCAKLLKNAKTIDFICLNFYCYRQREGSIRHSIDLKKCNDLKNNIVSTIKIAESVQDSEKVFFYHYSAYQYGTFLKNQAYCDRIPEKCINELSKYKWIFDYHGGLNKLKILKLGVNILGLNRLCRFIRGCYRLRKK